MFETVGDEAIRSGKCTDIYFERIDDILQKDGINLRGGAEITMTALPESWVVFCGFADVLAMLDELSVTVEAMP